MRQASRPWRRSSRNTPAGPMKNTHSSSTCLPRRNTTKPPRSSTGRTRGGTGGFRIRSSRNSSEACFLNRVKATYGLDCVIYYGNWSRKDQMKGCEPSPIVGLKKALRKRFSVIEVDEFRTSRTCNACMGELESYRKKDGKRSYSRLCCTNCRRPNDRSNRDLNAASNILLAGISSSRPEALRRKRKRSREEKDENRPTVDAVGISSDPAVSLAYDTAFNCT